MSTTNIDELVVIDLKYSTRARSQKSVALSEIVSKALYVLSKPVTIKKVRNQVTKIIGVPIGNSQIEEGLRILESEKKVNPPKYDQEKNKLWVLTEKEKESISKRLKKSELELEGVLVRHFPEDIDSGILKNWFWEVSAQFFGHYSTQWIATINKGARFTPPQSRQFTDFLKTPNKNYELSNRAKDLQQAYISFLSSDNEEDSAYLMSMGLAMFSARLLAAGIGVDPLTIEELSGGKFMLDTNILLSIQLDNKRISKSLIALGKALKVLNATLVYARATKEEYERVVDGKRATVTTVLDSYDDEVLREAEEDDFIQTIRQRGLKSTEEYEEFFNDIRELPTQLIEGLPIKLKEDEVLEQKAIDAQKDNRLKSILEDNKKQFSHYRSIPRPRSIEHDASLIYIARNLRQEDEKCWIISLEKALQMTALATSSEGAIPLVLSLEALIEILALNNAGPSLNTTDFAPLLSNILVNHCIPQAASFNSTDLEQLHNIYEDASTLPKEKVISLVRHIHRARIQGIPIDDSRVQARLNKEYNRQLKNHSEELQLLKSEIENVKAEADSTKKEKKRLYKQALSLQKKELKRTHVKQLALAVLPRVISAVFVAGLILSGTRLADVNHTILDYLTVVIALYSVYVWVKQPLKAFRSGLRNLDKEAEDSLAS